MSVPHVIHDRKGDANIRAVWLFSRNEAISNATVVAADAGTTSCDFGESPDRQRRYVCSAELLQNQRRRFGTASHSRQGLAPRLSRLHHRSFAWSRKAALSIFPVLPFGSVGRITISSGNCHLAK
jgi:hypothetical protein